MWAKLVFFLPCAWHADAFVRRHDSDVKLPVASGNLEEGGRFGSSVAVLSTGLAAFGQREAHGGGIRRGAVWLAEVSPSSAVHSLQVINANASIEDDARFGASLAMLTPPDSDDDSFLLAVGACEGICACILHACASGVPNLGYGSVYLLNLSRTGELLSPVVRITEGQSGLSIGLQYGDAFGRALASADVDGDGRRELFVSAQTCPSGFTRDVADFGCKNSVRDSHGDTNLAFARLRNRHHRRRHRRQRRGLGFWVGDNVSATTIVAAAPRVVRHGDARRAGCAHS